MVRRTLLITTCEWGCALREWKPYWFSSLGKFRQEIGELFSLKEDKPPVSKCCSVAFHAKSPSLSGVILTCHINLGVTIAMEPSLYLMWGQVLRAQRCRSPWPMIKIRLLSLMSKVIHNLHNKSFLASFPFPHVVLATSSGLAGLP